MQVCLEVIVVSGIVGSKGMFKENFGKRCQSDVLIFTSWYSTGSDQSEWMSALRELVKAGYQMRTLSNCPPKM